MTQDEIEDEILKAMKSDALMRGEADPTALMMCVVTIVRKLIFEKNISKQDVAQAVRSLGIKKNWPVMISMGEKMIEMVG